MISDPWSEKTHHVGWQNLISQSAQRFNDASRVVFLKETNAGYSSCPSRETRLCILNGDATQSQDGDVCLAGCAELDQTHRFCTGETFFLEHRGEDGERRTVRCGLGYVCWGVTRYCDQWISW